MEGYHGTMFAYGQTNSGKTYTMFGIFYNFIIKSMIKKKNH